MFAWIYDNDMISELNVKIGTIFAATFCFSYT